MSRTPQRRSLEDVLDAFSVEPLSDRATLERYIREYPDFAEDLVDLSRELAREVRDDEGALSDADQERIDLAWRGYAALAVADPLATMSTSELREVAQGLGVPRQVIAAFRERRIVLRTVPRRFLAQIAVAAKSTVQQLEQAWSEPSALFSASRSYKADHKPEVAEQISFEQLLVEAGLSAKDRAELLKDAD